MEHDQADIETTVACPTLAFWGANGLVHKQFDIEAEWRKRCTNVRIASLPRGHFFIDTLPEETAKVLEAFLSSN